MRNHIRSRLDALLARPGTWGSPNAVELQFIQLLECLYVLDRPDDNRPRVILDSYIVFTRNRIPDAPSFMLAETLERAGRVEELPTMLAAFRAHVEGRIVELNRASEVLTRSLTAAELLEELKHAQMVITRVRRSDTTLEPHEDKRLKRYLADATEDMSAALGLCLIRKMQDDVASPDGTEAARVT